MESMVFSRGARVEYEHEAEVRKIVKKLPEKQRKRIDKELDALKQEIYVSVLGKLQLYEKNGRLLPEPSALRQTSFTPQQDTVNAKPINKKTNKTRQVSS